MHPRVGDVEDPRVVDGEVDDAVGDVEAALAVLLADVVLEDALAVVAADPARVGVGEKDRVGRETDRRHEPEPVPGSDQVSRSLPCGSKISTCPSLTDPDPSVRVHRDAHPRSGRLPLPASRRRLQRRRP